MRILLTLLLLSSTAYAQGSAPTKLIFLNECPDLAPGDVYKRGMSAEEYIALTERWECLNRTQASQRQETFEKVWAASYNVKLSKPVTILSIDPKIKNGDYIFGAWIVKRGKHPVIEFADMPSCTNARKILERKLRELKLGAR